METFYNMDTLNAKPESFEEPHIVSRKKWKAENPKEAETKKDFPLPYLVLMNTNTPVCKTKKECRKTVQQLQKKHMDEGAPDILHNYLISIDGTVYEGRSPKMVGVTYNDDDETMSKASNNSINIAYIDDQKEKLTGEKLHSAVTKLAAKLVRDNIINQDVEIIWFDQNKKKKKKLPLSERMEKYRSKNENNQHSPPMVVPVTRSKNKRVSKKTKNSFQDTVTRVDKQGPFILEPHHFGMLIDLSDQFEEEDDDKVVFI